MKDRHWSINGRFLGQTMTGVQRYAHAIVSELDRLVAERHPLTQGLKLEILVPASVTKLPKLRSIPIRTASGLSGHLWEQLTLPRRARGGILSLGNTSTVFKRRQIVCMHDLNTFTRPNSYSLPFRLLYRGLLPILGRRAHTIVTVSRYSADQIAQAKVARSDKIVVAPNGHEHVLKWKRPSTLEDPTPSRADTIVVLGSLAPHKNLATLLRIAPELGRHGLKLAIVGRLDRAVFGDLAPPADDPAVAWLGPLSDAELADLLPTCLCLAFPSLAEGFGLPPLEAMVLGCPVVVSDRTSIPEVCGDAALYAPAEASEIWLARFLRLRDDPDLRSEMIRRGQERIKHFSWQASAKTYLRAMASADGMFEIAAAPSVETAEELAV